LTVFCAVRGDVYKINAAQVSLLTLAENCSLWLYSFTLPHWEDFDFDQRCAKRSKAPSVRWRGFIFGPVFKE